VKNNLKVGLTGGIGSGKTIVSRIFKALGVPIYDADSRAKFLTNNDPDLREGIITLLGENAYDQQGLNNTWIASQVFNNENKLDLLNKLIHPAVALDFQKWLNNSEADYVVKEAALLYEAGSYQDLDKIIVVSAPEELRMKRVLERDPHRDRDQVEDIIKRQWPEAEKVKRADFVIVNDEQNLVVPQVLKLHKKLGELIH
jgi:dephospho-CoA kinase